MYILPFIIVIIAICVVSVSVLKKSQSDTTREDNANTVIRTLLSIKLSSTPPARWAYLKEVSFTSKNFNEKRPTHAARISAKNGPAVGFLRTSQLIIRQLTLRDQQVGHAPSRRIPLSSWHDKKIAFRRKFPTVGRFYPPLYLTEVLIDMLGDAETHQGGLRTVLLFKRCVLSGVSRWRTRRRDLRLSSTE